MILKKLILTIIASFPSTKNWFNQVRLTFRKLFNIDYEKDIDQIPKNLIHSGSLAIDIGANRGDFTQSLLSRGFKVVAFEPNPIPFELMKKRFHKADHLKLHNVACGCKNESLVLHIPSYKKYQIEGLASFHENQVLGVLDKIRELKPYYFFDKKHVYHKSIEVKLVKLDDFNLQPDFIKIDTEGYELEVLKGATNTIQTSKPTLYLENPNQMTLALLNQLGYQKFFQGKNNQIFIPNSS